MRRLSVFIFFLIIASTYAQAADVLLGPWRIHLPENEKTVTSSQQAAALLYLSQSKVTFLTRDAEPVSIKRMPGKIEKHKGDPKSLRIIRKNGYAIFNFKTKAGDWIWYSTKGGYLQADAAKASQANLSIFADAVSWAGAK